MRRIDINTDTGESFGRWKLGDDESLLRWVSSANVACGMHAGDPLVMDSTVAACGKHGVSVGAHPGYPDLQGFGRREIRMTAAEIEAYMLYQIGALNAFLEARQMKMTHVKAHGSLYNMACVDEGIALAVARGIAKASKEGRPLVLVGLPGSSLIWAGGKVGLPVASEGFCDRAYQDDGNLVPRSKQGSVITDLTEIAARAVRMVRDGRVTTETGKVLELNVDTVCIHSDTPGAPAIAKAVSEALVRSGVEIAAIDKVLGI